MIEKVIEKNTSEDKSVDSTVKSPTEKTAEKTVIPAVIPAAKPTLDKTKVKTNDDTDGVKAVDETRHEDSPLEQPESEIISVEGSDAMSYAEELAFMNEKVQVIILDSQNASDTTRLCPIGVNGKTYHLLRGEWSTVPRFVLEILAKTKKESWNFAYKKNSDGSTSDTNQMHRILRYPHQFKDTNPKGMAWYDSIKNTNM